MDNTHLTIYRTYKYYEAVAYYIKEFVTEPITNYLIDATEVEKKDTSKSMVHKNNNSFCMNMIDLNKLEIQVNMFPDIGEYSILYDGKILKAKIFIPEKINLLNHYVVINRAIEFYGNLDSIHKFITDGIEKFLDKQRDRSKLRIFTPNNTMGTTIDLWIASDTFSKLTEDKVYFPKKKKENIIQDVTEFRSTKTIEWFEKNNVSYRRCYLFYGPSGVEQMEVVMMIASIFNMDVYLLSNRPSHPMNRCSTNLDITKDIPENSILLIKDIESMLNQQNNQQNNIQEEMWGVSTQLSREKSKMEFLDEYSKGIVVMITNNKELLDSQCFDYSYIDCEVEFSYLDKDEIKRMVVNFYPELAVEEHTDLVNSFAERLSKAEVSQSILKRLLVKHKNYTDLSILDYIAESIENINEYNKKVKEELENTKQRTEFRSAGNNMGNMGNRGNITHMVSNTGRPGVINFSL